MQWLCTVKRAVFLFSPAGTFERCRKFPIILTNNSAVNRRNAEPGVRGGRLLRHLRGELPGLRREPARRPAAPHLQDARAGRLLHRWASRCSHRAVVTRVRFSCSPRPGGRDPDEALPEPRRRQPHEEGAHLPPHAAGAHRGAGARRREDEPAPGDPGED